MGAVPTEPHESLVSLLQDVGFPLCDMSNRRIPFPSPHALMDFYFDCSQCDQRPSFPRVNLKNVNLKDSFLHFPITTFLPLDDTVGWNAKV